MRRPFLSSLFAWAFFLLGGSLAGQDSIQNGTRTIEVYGHAEKKVPLEFFQVALLISAEGKTMAVANDQFENQLEKIKTVFNEMDFPGVEIIRSGKLIIDQSLLVEDDWDREEVPEGTPSAGNLIVREQIYLKWRCSTQASPNEIENGLSSLIDRIRQEKLPLVPFEEHRGEGGSSFVRGGSSSLREEQNSLRAAALKDAKEEAQAFAELAGCKLGRIVRLSVIGRDMLADPDDSQLLFPPGSKIPLSLSVAVTFEIE